MGPYSRLPSAVGAFVRCRLTLAETTRLGSMFHATQWMKSPEGASGSWTTRATDCVPSGRKLQASGGDTSAPSPVYFAGIEAPSAKAVLVSSGSGIRTLDISFPPLVP